MDSSEESKLSNVSNKLLEATEDNDYYTTAALLDEEETASQVDDASLIKGAILSLKCEDPRIRGTIFSHFLKRFHAYDIDPTFMCALKEGYDQLTSKPKVTPSCLTVK